MLDCGLHPGHHGMQSLPYFDDVDLAEVDLALITHFHLDHCAAVPYLACKTRFKVKVKKTNAAELPLVCQLYCLSLHDSELTHAAMQPILPVLQPL